MDLNDVHRVNTWSKLLTAQTTIRRTVNKIDSHTSTNVDTIIKLEDIRFKLVNLWIEAEQQMNKL